MKRRWKILLGVVMVLAIAALYLLNPRLPSPQSGVSAELYADGQLRVKREPISLIDSSRPTAPNGGFAGSPVRQLDGYVWYPQNQEQGPFPLIVYSHGFMSSVAEPDYLVDFLVPKGYIIVAVNFPLSTGTAPGGPNAADVINQPGDVSFLIDAMLARNADVSDSLYGLVDPGRIAAVGLSLGGLTTQLVAYHRDLKDPRISAAVSIAGPSTPLERQFFQTSDIPFMMIAGSGDAVVPYEANAAPMPGKVNNSVLVTLEQGSHVGFAGMATKLFRWFDHPDSIVCPLVLRGLDREDAAPASIIVPDPVIGISDAFEPPCTMHAYPRAMRPAEQQMLTRLALLAFLERTFSHDEERRAAMAKYLTTDFAAENSAVHINLAENDEDNDLFDRFLAYFTNADVDGILSLFDRNALFWGTGSTSLVTTPEGIAEYFSGMRARVPGQVEARSLGTESRVLNRDAVMVSGMWQAGPPESPATPLRVSLVLARQEGGWRIMQFHNSRVPAE